MRHESDILERFDDPREKGSREWETAELRETPREPRFFGRPVKRAGAGDFNILILRRLYGR